MLKHLSEKFSYFICDEYHKKDSDWRRSCRQRVAGHLAANRESEKEDYGMGSQGGRGSEAGRQGEQGDI